MRKSIFKNVLSGGTLTPSDLSPKEKVSLYALMQTLEGTTGFTYTRFFRDGFAQWEIDGIWKCKVEYVKHLQTQEKMDIEVRCVKTVQTPDGETYSYRHFYTGADGEEHSFDLTGKGDFWQFLGDIRHRVNFARWMADRGMMSEVTVRKRFLSDDWRQYELCGICNVVEQYIERQREAARR